MKTSSPSPLPFADKHFNTPKLFSGLQTPNSVSKTPRKYSTPHSGIDSENRSCIISFIENVSNREVGVAALRIYPPVLTLYQFTDTALYTHSRHLIEVHTPTKVLIPGNLTTNKSPLSQMIKENSKNISDLKWSNLSTDENEFSSSYIVCEVSRSKFSDSLGVDILSELSNNNNIFDNTDDQLINRYLCISAAAGCMLFAQTEYNFNVFPHTLKIHFQTIDDQLMIDPITLRQFSILSTPISSALSSCSSMIALSLSVKTHAKNNQGMFKLFTSKRNYCSPTLFNALDRCLTPSGTRLLRTTLASPPTKINIIQERQEFIAELASSFSAKPSIYYDLIEVFTNIADLDSVITFFVIKETSKISGSSYSVDSLQRLLFDVEKVHTLHDILCRMESSLAKEMTATIESTQFNKIGEIISAFLEPDPEIFAATSTNSVRNDASKQIYAIRPQNSEILDIARKSYEDSLSKIFNHAKDLSEKYNMKIIVKYNKSRGYYFQINKSQLENVSNKKKKKGTNKTNVFNSVVDIVDQLVTSSSGYLIPPEMIHVVENSNYIIGTTFDLLLLNKNNLDTQNDIIDLTQKIVEGKIEEIRPFIGDIYKVSEIIAFIDYLLSLATVACEYNDYSIPKITNNQIYALRKARHPVMEKLVSSSFASKMSSLLLSSTPSSEAESHVNFVPNDLDLTVAKSMMILKGVNMSGKTTYLQMAVQIAIMAQCGSFVPCENCVIHPFTSIFTRSGTNDSIEGNASAFLVEMREMNHIISLADSNSLVAIDEPCISTSVRDGIGLSFACLEKLISSRSFVLCSTHFNELEELSNLYPSIIIKEMRIRDVPKICINKGGSDSLDLSNETTKNCSSKFEYLYTIGDISNFSSSSGYGIITAKDYYPTELIHEAETCFEKLKKEEVGNKTIKSTGNMAYFSILQQLLALKGSTLNDDELRSFIQNLQKLCPRPNKYSKS